MLNVLETTERLARLVAAKTGTTPEAVIDEAVKDRARAARKARLRRAADDLAALPLIDPRSSAEIMDELNAL